MSISRRTLLKSGTLAAAGAALSPSVSARPIALLPPEDTENMHLSLAAYSVREALTSGEMDLFGFIDWCAELGLRGTELTSYYFPEGFDNDYLHGLRLHAFKNGVTISGTAIRNDFCRPDGPGKQADIEHTKRWIDHAAEIFAPHIRIFAGNLPDGVDKATGIQWVAEGIREVLDYAAQRGVVLGLENHGGITARAADHLAILDAVGEHEWFGVNLDTGNFRTNAYEELAMVAPHAVNVQVKSDVRRNDGTEVETDLERIRDMLVDANYRGWVVLEYEEENSFEHIPVWLDRMREVFWS